VNEYGTQVSMFYLSPPAVEEYPQQTLTLDKMKTFVLEPLSFEGLLQLLVLQE
jgi:hypothetical protein